MLYTVHLLEGLEIDGETEWGEVLDEIQIERIEEVVALKVDLGISDCQKGRMELAFGRPLQETMEETKEKLEIEKP